MCFFQYLLKSQMIEYVGQIISELDKFSSIRLPQMVAESEMKKDASTDSPTSVLEENSRFLSSFFCLLPAVSFHHLLPNSKHKVMSATSFLEESCPCPC
ncbi:uncharacterized protein LOC110658556 isoform X2 [Hevea brasiliensis]|uniref:uncharacterized protein LOC110658556 isoform X2 n=1 Tax=Hevea brasiliensis TaxID=3981 RepID=UPI0025F6B590|nr:uncharacterized protein LOC110658556 isoform X2 [Hevea brasiliensis]